MTLIYSNVLGSFLFDKECNLLAEKRFASLADFKNRDKFEAQLQKEQNKKSKAKKAAEAQKPNKEQLQKILAHFQTEEHKKKFQKTYRERNLELCKEAIRTSVSQDNLITQAIANINDLDKITNQLSKRLRDWFNLSLPELDHNIEDHEHFVNLILAKTRKDLLKELKLKEEESMGAQLQKHDIKEIELLAQEIKNLYQLRKSHEKYLQEMMEDYCPNFLELAGTTIGAKLFEHAKSLRRLALLPSSTIQLLGAEKALFRHIKTGAPSPKYGVIFTHPLVQRAPRKKQGMMARTLASKLSIAAKVDFFKGEFMADKAKEELEKKLAAAKKA